MKEKGLSKNLVDCAAILNRGGFHSGDEIGEKLGMSRTMVWKLITQLKEYGVEIESKKTEGYQLVKPIYLVDIDRISKEFTELEFDVFEAIPSTNTYLLDHTDQAARLCIAECQTAGKGRLGRTWQSPFGQNIYLSYLWPFAGDIAALNGLSLVVGLALVKTLEPFNLPDLKLKWPNDVYVAGKKLAGILIELKAETCANARVVIGSGINVNVDAKAADWASIAQYAGEQNRNDLIISYLSHLFEYLQRFEQKGLGVFLDEYETVDFLKGKSISVKNQNQVISGVAQGVDERGFLLLQTDSGIQRFSAGDTTLSV